MTTKQKYIEGIECLYPTDSEYKDVNLIGQMLLLDSITEPGFDWRDLPENLLRIYHDKCVEHERIQNVRPSQFSGLF